MPQPPEDIHLKQALDLFYLIARTGCNYYNDDSVTREVSKKLVPMFPWIDVLVESQPEAFSHALSVAHLRRTKGKYNQNFFPIGMGSQERRILLMLVRIRMNKHDDLELDLIIFPKREPIHPIGFRIEHGRAGANDIHGYLHIQPTIRFSTAAEPERQNSDISLPDAPPVQDMFPSPPLAATVPYASVYCGLIALLGHSQDGAKGVLAVLEGSRKFFDGGDFNHLRDRIKTELERLVRPEPTR